MNFNIVTTAFFFLSLKVFAEYDTNVCYIASTGSSQSVISANGDFIIPPDCYAEIKKIGNGYFWGTTNLNVLFTSTLISPDGVQITVSEYAVVDDTVSGCDFPEKDNTNGFIEVSKMLNGTAYDSLLFMDGREVTVGTHSSGRWLDNDCKFISVRNPDLSYNVLNILSGELINGFECDNIFGGENDGLVFGLGQNKGVWDIYSNNVVISPNFDDIEVRRMTTNVFYRVARGTNSGLYAKSGGWIYPCDGTWSVNKFPKLKSGDTDMLPVAVSNGTTCKIVDMCSGLDLLRQSFGYIQAIGRHSALLVTNGVAKLIAYESGVSMNAVSENGFSLEFIGDSICGDIWSENIPIGNEQLRGFYLVNNGEIVNLGTNETVESTCSILVETNGVRRVIPAFFTARCGKNSFTVFTHSGRLLASFPTNVNSISSWNGHILAENSSGVLSAVSVNGDVLIPESLVVTELDVPDVSGYSKIVSGGKCGLINSCCTFVIPCIYDDVGIPSFGLVPVKQSGKWGYANIKGELVIEPKFDYARTFSFGCAAVRKGTRWGLISVSGQELCPFIYDWVKDVHGMSFRGKINGKWKLYAIDGTCLQNTEFDRIVFSSEENEFLDACIEKEENDVQ